MAWRVSDTVAKAAEGVGISRDKLEAEADRIAGELPELGDREQALLAWVHANVDPQLDPGAMLNMLAGFVRDVWAGVAGKDPKAHEGNV